MSAVAVAIPDMGESVNEAILVRWLKQTGEAVAIDEPICVLETDKADVELPSPAAGVLTTKRQEGDTVQVGHTIASVDADAQAAPAVAPPTDSAAETAADTPINVSPAVRRLLQEQGLDTTEAVAAIPATGKGGRLTKADIEAHLASADAAPAPAPPSASLPIPIPPPATAATTERGERREPMSKLRRRIAERMVTVKQQTAMLTTFNEVDMSEIMALRSRYKEPFAERHGVSLGFMSFFARTVAIALAEFPAINAEIDGDEIVFRGAVNLGIAVSTDRGLVVPVIRDADVLSFAALEGEVKRLGQAARDNTLELAALGGGTFTITNGGVFGSLLSTPILNPPQSGILGMHAIQRRPVAVGDAVEIRPMMYVALSYDHRIVDGRESVSFLVRVKQLLEDPGRLMLEV